MRQKNSIFFARPSVKNRILYFDSMFLHGMTTNYLSSGVYVFDIQPAVPKKNSAYKRRFLYFCNHLSYWAEILAFLVFHQN